MLSVSEKIGDYVGGHVMNYVIDNVISKSWYWKGIQTTFLKKLIIILKKGQSYAKVINIKHQKVKDFSLSQNVGLVCR